MLLIYIIIVTLLLPLLHRILLYLHHESVLGSFQERVRRSPIRLSEVIERNRAGTECARVAGAIYYLQWFLCSSCNDYCITLLDPFSSFQKHRQVSLIDRLHLVYQASHWFKHHLNTDQIKLNIHLLQYLKSYFTKKRLSSFFLIRFEERRDYTAARRHGTWYFQMDRGASGRIIYHTGAR